MKNEINKPVGVVGTGVLGKQIASHLVRSGYSVLIKSRTSETAKKALVEIKAMIGAWADGYGSISATDSYDDLGKCKLIIESVVENLDVKMEVLSYIDRVADGDVMICSNTSTLSIDRLAESMTNRHRFAGMHFFNPVHKMKLGEVIVGNHTSEKTRNFVINFTKSIGRYRSL